MNGTCCLTVVSINWQRRCATGSRHLPGQCATIDFVPTKNNLSSMERVYGFLESSAQLQCQWKLGNAPIVRNNAPIVRNKERELSLNGMCLGNEVKNSQTVLGNHNRIKALMADHLKRVAACAYVKQRVPSAP
jgi:hypothetical protein